MNTRLIFITLPVVLLSMACLAVSGLGKVIRGSGKVVSETRPVSNFEQVSVCCGMHLILTQGETESLEIEADDNLLPEIVSTLEVGKLTIRFKDTNGGTQYRPTQPIRIKVSAIHIRGLEVSGGGSLEAGKIDTDRLDIGLSGGSLAKTGSIAADTMKLGISGGGDFSAQDLRLTHLEVDLSGGSMASIQALESDSLKLGSSGGGKITLAGSVAEQDLELSGGTEYKAGDLESERVTISMSGGGESTLWVKEALQVDLSGGARVKYYGRPLITEQISGGSKLDSLGDR